MNILKFIMNPLNHFRKFENFPMLNLGEITVLVGRNNAGNCKSIYYCRNAAQCN